jgi:hypothetical protein
MSIPATPYGPPYAAPPAAQPEGRCPACPLTGPESAGLACPSADWPGYCAHAARELTRDPARWHWRPKIVREAARLAGESPRSYPPPTPPDGRIRVGICSPCCNLGGADLWMSWLMAGCDASRIRWEGVALVSAGVPIDPGMRADWERHGPFAVGPAAIRELGARVDVLVAWGVFMSWGIGGGQLAAMLPPGLPVVAVSHGSLGAAAIPGDDGFPGCVPAAVSRAALRGLPEALRDRATVIPNGIDLDRVRPARPRADMLAEWGLPADAKIMGWLARMSPEKRPLEFVDGVAALPGGWYGVMAGGGHSTEMTRAHAAEVAPGRVRLLGARHDIGDVLGAFDCLCLPTESEACCLAAGECWAAGVPLIMTETGLLEERPDLARIIPNPPTGEDIAAAVLADEANREATQDRVDAARSFAVGTLGLDRFQREWTEIIVEAARSRPVPGPHLASCGDDVWVGSRVACEEQAARFDRVVHVWRDDQPDYACRFAAEPGGCGLSVRWKEYRPAETLDEMRPGLDEVVAFAKVPGRLLLHCAGGVTRSTVLALAAKIARGCLPARAEADIRAAMLRDRGIPVQWIESVRAEVVRRLGPVATSTPAPSPPSQRAAARPVSSPAPRAPLPPVPAVIPPEVVEAISRCVHRGSELPMSDPVYSRGCCGGGKTRWECRDGRGSVPGKPTLSDCVGCKA